MLQKQKPTLSAKVYFSGKYFPFSRVFQNPPFFYFHSFLFPIQLDLKGKLR